MIDRNDVLDKAINIEAMISSLITLKFFPLRALKMDFLEIMLNDEGATANYKRSVLIKCYPEARKIDNEIRSIFQIRNIFAHSGAFIFHSVDNSNPINLDPRKPGSDVDLEKKKERFYSDYSKVNDFLFEMLQKTGVIYE